MVDNEADRKLDERPAGGVDVSGIDEVDPGICAAWMMRIESSWSELPQRNIIMPRHSFESCTPVRPSGRYSMIGLLVSGFGDLAAERLEGDRVGLGAAAPTCVQYIDCGDVVVGELEVEHVDVFSDPARLVDFGMTERPCCTPQRSITCAGVFPFPVAISPMTGSSSVLPWLPSR